MSSCSIEAAESEVDITWEEEDEVDTKAAASTDGWHIFGRECPKEEIVFLCQVIILYTVIVVSIYNLTVGHGDSTLWVASVCSTGRQLRPRSVCLRWREAREHPPRWRCRRPCRKACMCTHDIDYQCRRKWRLMLLTSHTAAPNARGRFRLDADWRCTKLAGAALDSAMPPDGVSSLTKPAN